LLQQLAPIEILTYTFDLWITAAKQYRHICHVRKDVDNGIDVGRLKMQDR